MQGDDIVGVQVGEKVNFLFKYLRLVGAFFATSNALLGTFCGNTPDGLPTSFGALPGTQAQADFSIFSCCI